MKIAVAAESDAGEPRAAATPETVRKMVALDADVAVEPDAGMKSGFSMPTMPLRATVTADVSTAPKSCCKCGSRSPPSWRA